MCIKDYILICQYNFIFGSVRTYMERYADADAAVLIVLLLKVQNMLYKLLLVS